MYHPKPPPGVTKVGTWFISNNSILRHVYYDTKKSFQRYPKKYYRKLGTIELEKFVARLNGRNLKVEQAKAAAIFRHAFISPDLLDEFERLVHSGITVEKDAKYRFKMVRKHFLNYFIVELNLTDPIDWYRRQLEWGQYLLSLNKSQDSIQKLIQKSNLFMRFLHERYPQEIPLVTFKPISAAKMKKHEAQRKLDSDDQPGQFIPDEDWAIIESKLPSKIKPYVQLAYYYGLRRAECLAIELDDIGELRLNVSKVMEETRTYGPPKNRMPRKTDHWFIKPISTYRIVEQIPDKSKRLTPNRLGKEFAAFIREIGMDYEMHDLRRTFITKALDLQTPKAVRLAVGHKNINTTMLYLMDDTDREDKPFKPVG